MHSPSPSSRSGDNSQVNASVLNFTESSRSSQIVGQGVTGQSVSTMLFPADNIPVEMPLQPLSRPDSPDEFRDIELGEPEERGNFDNLDIIDYARISNNIPPNSNARIILDCGSILDKLKGASHEAINSIMNGFRYLIEFAKLNSGKFKDWVEANWVRNHVLIRNLKDWIEEAGESLNNASLVFFTAVLTNIIQLVSSGFSNKPVGKIALLTNGSAFMALLFGHTIRGRKRTLSALLVIAGIVISCASYFHVIYTAF